MDDSPKIHDQDYTISALPVIPDDRSRVLKHGYSFAVFNRYGNIPHAGLHRHDKGIYHEDTRFLSRLELIFADGSRPLLLNSTIKKDNSLFVVDLTNPDLYENDSLVIPQDTIHIFRAKVLWQGSCYEHLRFTNYENKPVEVSFILFFDADFCDIFEVRGTKRLKKGERLPDKIMNDEVVLGYVGLDQEKRQTRITFSPAPARITASEIHFSVLLPPRINKDFYLTISCEDSVRTPRASNYQQAIKKMTKSIQSNKLKDCQIVTSNEQFNEWINRAAADLHLLITQTPEGPYPFAGVPWFNTQFGRDGIITALQTLWINPDIARGVLAYLARTQAREVNRNQEAEPGKILHETRRGEMAKCKEIAFGKYYGSVDATPLFVMLANAYYERTGDRGFIESIWNSIELALAWINNYGDADGDGFVEYVQHSDKGLVQQGWKDSNDSIFHADGSAAQGPIALCEVQGYVYAVWRDTAKLLRIFGNAKRADKFASKAEQLREQFNRSFWCEEISTFAIALDGKKRACRVRSSNAGHALYTEIALPEYARRTAATLLHNKSFSGWGIRTIAATEANYNPMSYHNGSIWPHDNALIAMGLSHYGYKAECLQIMTGLFKASINMDLQRMPELFCGFLQRPGQGPTQYPVACIPQAWAAATVFYLLQACLGLSFSREKEQIRFYHPQLPQYLDWVEIHNLRHDHGTVDLVLKRHAKDVSINLLSKTGEVDIVAVV